MPRADAAQTWSLLSRARVEPATTSWARTIALALVVFGAIYALSLVAGTSPGLGLSMLLVIPVGMAAIAHGISGGLVAAAMAAALLGYWDAFDDSGGLGWEGHAVRDGVYLLVGLASGWSAEQIRRVGARQSRIAESLGEMISAHAPDGRYRYASSTARQLLGYEPHQLIGRSPYDLLHPEDAAVVRQAHDAGLTDDGKQTLVYRVRRADGRYVWHETVSLAVRVDDVVEEIVCSTRDVTRREIERMALDEDREALATQIEDVLRQRSITPVVQPIVHLPSGDVVGFEALARFPQDDRPPDVWFQKAEQLGLAEALELLAIERALEVFRRLPGESWLTVNASPHTARSPRLPDILRGFPLGRLVIELTEHAAIGDAAAFNEATGPLRRGGLRLAVDDAGAGYSSLRRILEVQPELIKLDMSLTRNIHRDQARRALTSALCGFADSIGAIVVAEGVETQDELQALRALGVEYAQGYLLGRPRPA